MTKDTFWHLPSKIVLGSPRVLTSSRESVTDLAYTSD